MKLLFVTLLLFVLETPASPPSDYQLHESANKTFLTEKGGGENQPDIKDSLWVGISITFVLGRFSVRQLNKNITP